MHTQYKVQLTYYVTDNKNWQKGHQKITTIVIGQPMSHSQGTQRNIYKQYVGANKIL